jgi:hypothetical protein
MMHNVKYYYFWGEEGGGSGTTENFKIFLNRILTIF